MTEPVVAAKVPAKVTLEAGKDYWWCSCGHSAHQPFCDGSHKGTGLQPVKFEVTEKKTIWWCQCKHSANPPLCDGSHKSLPKPE